MKNLIFIFVLIMSIITGCDKSWSSSTKPAALIVVQIDQKQHDKENHVCMYKIKYISFDIDGSKWLDYKWYTLSEGFQVGDTLTLCKKYY